MLLALFEVFPCVIRTLDSPVKLCMSLILCFKMLLCVCFPELYVVLRELDSATIVIEVSEQIHCKCISGPSYLIPATVCKAKLLDLSWYTLMKTVMAVSGAFHLIP